MGTTPLSGHYIVHLLKNGQWYIFNDEKVCLSQVPPKSKAYLYIYERM